jgi:hypothetical protein
MIIHLVQMMGVLHPHFLPHLKWILDGDTHPNGSGAPLLGVDVKDHKLLLA